MSKPDIDGTAAVEMEQIPQRLERVQLMPVTSRPATLIEAVLDIICRPDLDMDRLERLLAMQERLEAREAEKAFVTSLSAFKANPPEIIKGSLVDFKTDKGHTHYSYADLEEVATPINKAMAPYGLSFRWRPTQQAGKVIVTTILQHAQGYKEEVTLEGAPDQSGNKNSIQAVGSAISYLSRYGLLAITGLASKDQDTDGRPPKAQPEDSPVVIQDETAKIAQAKDSKEVSVLFNAAYGAAAKAGDQVAKDALLAAQKKRLAELKGGQK